MIGRLDHAELQSAKALFPAIVGSVAKVRRAGSEWKACCLFHRERTPSFTIFMSGDGTWRGYCFGCGWSGDAIDFLRQLRGVGLREAVALATRGELPTVEVAPITRKDEGDKLDQVRTIWRNAGPAKHSPAEAYLRWRKIDQPIPESIRFASLKYGRSGREYPCLVACIAGPDNRLCGLQRTYLADHGRGKADVPKPKLSLGRVSGGAIRLAPAAEELIVCEGLEDGLTLQQELGHAVWVSAGTAMLPAMQFPPIVCSVAIAGDGDAAGRAAAVKAAKAFAARGLFVRTFFPSPPYKDFNDELRGVQA